MATNEEIMYKLGETQADIRNLGRTLDEIKKGMTTYTADCTADRASQEKRITAVEGFQSRQLKVAGSISLAISTAIGLVAEYFKKG